MDRDQSTERLALVDTHCHIQSAGRHDGERTTRELWAKAGDADPDAIIERAHDAGVGTLVCVGCDGPDSQLAVDFVQNRDKCYAAIGLHPHEAQKYIGQKGLLDAFAGLVARPKVVAVGECGLDYFYNHSPKAAQLEMLHFQIELALKADLPMIFHVREAFDDFWPVFESYRGIRGVLHSFTDSEEHLRRAITRGLFIGVNGIVTFAKRPEQQAMYRAIPLEHLLLETDAPFLTPVPDRGKICEPYHIRTTAEFLADLRGESIETVARVTTRNAQHLFGY
jgi:TatD DNase family protein